MNCGISSISLPSHHTHNEKDIAEPCQISFAIVYYQ